MSKRKLLFATALFVSTGAMASELTPALEVTRVVTNGKGGACTFVADASPDHEPEIVDTDTGDVLLPGQFTWDGVQLCLSVEDGRMSHTLTIRFPEAPDPAVSLAETAAEPRRSGLVSKNRRKES